jgi:hypothetical protein
VSWTLRFRERPKDDDPPKVGDCWYAPEMVNEYRDHYLQYLSDEYKTTWLGKRPPIIVQLPGGKFGFGFCIDEGARNNGVWSTHGWTVTGELPKITVSPSINCIGIYHGFIHNGVLTDDCEGRKFS